MDLYKAIRELYEEKEKLDHVITSLEELQKTAQSPEVAMAVTRRGRKSMSTQERTQVSERMKRYWARRRREPQHQNHA